MPSTTTTIPALLAIGVSHRHCALAQPFADCDVGIYYSNLPSPPPEAARLDMHELVRDTHRDQLPYTSSSYGDVWDALVDVDGDGSGESVRLVYKDAWVPAAPRDPGTCEYWNREHIWPRSRGVGASGKDNVDLHHVRPSDCNLNSARNNLLFGACGTAAPSSECARPAHVEAPLDTEKDSATFLPPAGHRGDVARAILYMDLRYDGDEGSTTLDLIASDCPEAVPEGAGMGYLSQLLQWHLDDPPDDEERQRNEKVCSDWQGNRNPFIDYPELASIYHGGPRPLLGEGLGYDCSIPHPPAGTCSDSSGPCSSAIHCLCSSSPASRTLLGRGDVRDQLAPDRELQASKLIITGVLDGPLPGGQPKAVELYALEEIPDLSAYGIGLANNGGGTDGEEFSLSGSVAAGEFITLSHKNETFIEYFGESPDFITGHLYINGDDAVELFFDGSVVDAFGDASVDGTGELWEYLDGWAYRQAGSAPIGNFDISEWTLSGTNAVDGCIINIGCGSVFPSKSFGNGSTLPPTPCECLI